MRERIAIALPPPLARFLARGLFHFLQELRISREPIQLFRDRFRGPNRDDKSVHALGEEIGSGGVGGGDHRQTLRHRLQNDEAESFEKRGQNQDIIPLHLRQYFAVRERRYPMMAPERLLQGPAAFRDFLPDQSEFGLAAKQVDRPQEIGQSFALA